MRFWSITLLGGISVLLCQLPWEVAGEDNSSFEASLRSWADGDKEATELITKLVGYIQANKFDVFKDSFGRLVNMKNSAGNTPLLHIAKYSNLSLDILEVFDQVETDFNDVDSDGKTVLVYAIEKGESLEIVETILENGGSISWRGKKGETLLHLAAATGDVAVVKLLLDDGRIDVNAKDNDRRTPLHWAVIAEVGRERAKAAAEELVKLGATPLEDQNESNVSDYDKHDEL